MTTHAFKALLSEPLPCSVAITVSKVEGEWVQLLINLTGPDGEVLMTIRDEYHDSEYITAALGDTVRIDNMFCKAILEEHDVISS